MPTRQIRIAVAALVVIVLTAALVLGSRTEPASAGIPTLLGDVSCDGGVTIADAQLIAQLIVGRISALDCPENADVNEDGGATIADAQLIAQLIVGRISSLPPTPTPGGLQIQHCWLAVVAFRIINPQVLQGFTDCTVPGSPDYSCFVFTGSFVDCDTFADWPDYSCFVFSFGDADCDARDFNDPDYNCFELAGNVDCNTFSLDWPDYSCTLSGELVSCTTFSFDFPDFSCNRVGSIFTCA